MRRSAIFAAIVPAIVFMLFAAESAGASAACALKSAGGRIKHVVYITFDNLHLRRDDPNVPSDLEQMPNLLNFILDNGTISGNHHTALISHTATGILTALTGVYGDRMGMPVSTKYGYFNADGSVGFTGSFLYWSALGGDKKPQMLSESGKTAPAPWVPFTRAGCDVGGFGVPNIELESKPDDVTAFFGAGSKEDQAARKALLLPETPENQPARQKPIADYLGIAIHCAKDSPLCGRSPDARPDLLPDEPHGYDGFNGLFGNIHVQPVISPAGPVNDLDGHAIQDAYGQSGFPGFNPTATQSLGYAAAMLEAGVPIVYVYIADAHERNPLPLDAHNKPMPNLAFGPGEAEYVAQLKAYDRAFGKFFARLQKDGITKDNTLFLIVPDENDHFVGGKPSPAGCDGVRVPCTYRQASEIGAQLNRLLLSQRQNATPFAVHGDSAPTVYIAGNPDPAAAVTRRMEHDLDTLTAVNPITGKRDKLAVFLADRAEMKLLHMVTASAARTPTLTMFGNENYFFSNAMINTSCTLPPACIELAQPPAATFAWNHGDVQLDITRTWLAMAGPGIRHQGRNDSVFSDHTDIRPTMMALLGLEDSYIHDGRILVEKLEGDALPRPLPLPRAGYIRLAAAYKQINAPLGSVGTGSLVTATRAIVRDRRAYGRYLRAISRFTASRDSLAAEMRSVLNAGVATPHRPVNAKRAMHLADRARKLERHVGR